MSLLSSGVDRWFCLGIGVISKTMWFTVVSFLKGIFSCGWLVSEDHRLSVLMLRMNELLLTPCIWVLTEPEVDYVVFSHLGHFLGISSIGYQWNGYVGLLKKHALSSSLCLILVWLNCLDKNETDTFTQSRLVFLLFMLSLTVFLPARSWLQMETPVWFF